MRSNEVNGYLRVLFYVIGQAVTTQVYAEVMSDSATTQPKSDEYMFDSTLFRGQSINQAGLMQRLGQKQTLIAGLYKVDVYVNGRFVERMQLEFKEIQQEVQPCFQPDMLKRIGLQQHYVDSAEQLVAQQQCFLLLSQVKGSELKLDFGRLRLNLSIPQQELQYVPRGYVNAAEWNAGSSIAFMNYTASYYYNSNNTEASQTHQDSAYLSLSSGMNFGKWQFRQQSSVNYRLDNRVSWENLQSYVMRAVPEIHGQLTLGQVYSSGQFFSGLSFNGLNIATDDRMLPESVRGYAPVVQGVAKTKAKVSILQNGKEIYQTSVAPGAFKITDLYPTNYHGDLTVLIYEADASVTQFKVPFSALPESLRAGLYRYNFDLGRTRDIGEDSYFSNITYQRGINNAVTLNTGLRIAEDFQAILLGATYSSFWGAFGSNMTYSHATIEQLGRVQGWLASLTYSKTMQPSNTHISIAGYRYSTEGYRDLSDVIGMRYALKNGDTWQSSSYLQRSRIELSVNQNLGRWGMLFMSGSLQDYYANRDQDIQMQLGYNKTFKNGVSLNLSLIRQTNATYQSSSSNDNQGHLAHAVQQSSRTDTTLSLSLSLPLASAKKARAPSLDLAYSHASDQSGSLQAMLSATPEKDHTINYVLGLSYDERLHSATCNGNLSKHFDNLSVGLSAAASQESWQVSGNAQGALAIHSGGITFGPYLSETFALIEAKGAYGAKVFNGQGASINKSGYALLPALTAYRYNSIALDPQGIPEQIEIQSGEQQVVPLAGAAIKVRFKTRIGYPLLLQTRLNNPQKEYVALGAEVLDEHHNIIGMVGQAGQIYVRTENRQGILHIQWGDDDQQRCRVEYTIDDQALQNTLIRLEQVCQLEHTP